MTFGHMVRLFWDMMGAELTNSPQVTNDILLRWANMSLERLCADAVALERETDILCTAAVQEYDLPDDCKRVWRAAYDGQKILLTSKWDLQQVDNTWDRSTGIPRRYYVNGLNGMIGLYPLPTTDTVVDPFGVVSFGLHIFYTAMPPQLLSPEDEPALPVWAHMGIVYGMLSMAYSMIGTQRRGPNAQYWKNRFDEVAMRLRVRTNMKTPKVWAIREIAQPEDWIMAKPRRPERIPPP